MLSLTDMFLTIHRGFVKHIVSFDAPKFHPSNAGLLLITVLNDHYLHRKSFVKHFESCLAHSSLGSHAKINILTPDKAVTYAWGNNTSRPFGVLPPICSHCQLPFTWQTRNVDSGESSVVLRCSVCRGAKSTYRITRPSDIELVRVDNTNKWYRYNLVTHLADV